MRVPIALFGAWCACAAVIAARPDPSVIQQPGVVRVDQFAAQQGVQARTLGAGDTMLMTVDFLAVGADGRPVTDLRADDITIKVDGKTRPVKSLQFIDDGAPSARAAASAAVPPPAPFATNTASPAAGRSFYIVIDNETMRPGGEVATIAAIDKFLTTLSPRDEVAIETVPVGGISLDPTSDFQKVKQALANLQGIAPTSESTDDATCRSMSVLDDLIATMNTHAASDKPVELIFVSTSLLAPRTQAMIAMRRTKCEVLPEVYGQLSAAAAAGHVHTFIVEPQQTSTNGLNMATAGGRTSGLVTSSNSTGTNDPTMGLLDVTGQTGGEQMQLALPTETAFDRIARETSGYYVASFETEAGEHNGANHPMAIHAERNGVTLLARPSVLLARAGAAAATPPAAISPKDMMKTAKVFRDLPLRVTSFAARNTGLAGDSSVKIDAVAETGEPGVRLSAATAGLYDATGKLIVQSSADAATLASSPLAFAFPPEPPGAYRLRVAATDTTGRGGSVDDDLDAKLTSVGPTKVSGLILGTSTGGFKPALEFHSEPDATLYFELYGPTSDGALAVELAATPNGKALAVLTPAAQPTSEPDRFIVLTPISLTTLAPGDYVVRVTVGVKGQPEARILKTLRKVGG